MMLMVKELILGDDRLFVCDKLKKSIDWLELGAPVRASYDSNFTRMKDRMYDIVRRTDIQISNPRDFRSIGARQRQQHHNLSVLIVVVT
jgi:hypothetical protein